MYTVLVTGVSSILSYLISTNWQLLAHSYLFLPIAGS